MATAVTSFQWFFWGYSLTFSHKSSFFIGDMENIGFRDVLAAPSVGSPRIPDLLFAVYQGMFAAITVALATGAVAERGRMLPCVVFMFIWSTVVYDPIACWHWNPSGWASRLGGLDFAGVSCSSTIVPWDARANLRAPRGHRFISRRGQQHLRTPTFLANVAAMAPRHSTSGLTISLLSSSAPCSFGLDGLASMRARH